MDDTPLLNCSSSVPLSWCSSHSDYKTIQTCYILMYITIYVIGIITAVIIYAIIRCCVYAYSKTCCGGGDNRHFERIESIQMVEINDK